jgi:hypothetical protein
MHIVKANKSASVRIEVKPIDFEKPFTQFANEVDEALKALCELYELSKVVATSANSGTHARAKTAHLARNQKTRTT